MTVYWIDPSGQIVQSASRDDTHSPLDSQPGVRRVVCAQALDVNAHYWDGQALQPMPPRPGPQHEFDYRAKAWRLDFGRALAALRAARVPLLAEADNAINRIEDAGGDASAWRRYRQALRDLTRGITDEASLMAVQWPKPPVE